MDYKKAIGVLTKMLKDGGSFTAEETEAVITAIGVLGFAKLARNRLTSIINNKKAKRDKDTKW